jgi:hypothetical protein
LGFYASFAIPRVDPPLEPYATPFSYRTPLCYQSKHNPTHAQTIASGKESLDHEDTSEECSDMGQIVRDTQS